MSENPRRLRVIEGGASSDKPKAKVIRRGSKDISIEKFECVPCSASLGHPYGTLIEARIGGHVIDGELVGGAMFWCCRRCERPHFHIKDCRLTK
ncbi:hypothetical protein [Mesorhizobium sp. Cs1299R1N3]|uniref:hypothetical protein n=1 Tax=Mesorhizobium sp. Cs1299R1N3 TaxID=3015173 RepID=UPI00301DDFD1